MPTPLTKTLKREVNVNGRPFVITLTPEGIAVTPKGKRKGQELRWDDLVSGDAALAVALTASLSQISEPDRPRQKRKGRAGAQRKRVAASET